MSDLLPLGKSIHLEVRHHSPEVDCSIVEEHERPPLPAVVRITREMDQTVVAATFHVQRGARRGCLQKTVAEEDCLLPG